MRALSMRRGAGPRRNSSETRRAPFLSNVSLRTLLTSRSPRESCSSHYRSVASAKVDELSRPHFLTSFVVLSLSFLLPPSPSSFIPSDDPTILSLGGPIDLFPFSLSLTSHLFPHPLAAFLPYLVSFRQTLSDLLEKTPEGRPGYSPEDLQALELPQSLASSRLLRHKDRDVRTYAAASLAQLMR